MKISLIGTGNIGSTLAYLLVSKSFCRELVMFDISPNAVGRGLDISQSQSLLGSQVRVNATDNINAIKGSDIVIVTAGVPRKQGMSREDALSVNQAVISEIGVGIKQNCTQDTLVVCVTNPLDVMAWLLLKTTQFPNNRVIGMAGALDTARCNYFIARALNVKPSNVSSIILGGHGDLMLAPPSYISVNGIPISEFIAQGLISQQDLDGIIKRTCLGGGEIIEKGGASAYYATAASIYRMIDAYKNDSRDLICCSVKVSNLFGIESCFTGVPCIIGANGVESVIELKLSASEKEQFVTSTSRVVELANNIGLL